MLRAVLPVFFLALVVNARYLVREPADNVTPTDLAPPTTKRAANPACLKSVELSCLNLAANCIDSVQFTGNVHNRDELWSIPSCVAGATCYGVGDLITAVNCQDAFSVTNSDQASLDYNTIYASIVGSCAFAPGGCPVTQQNYIDFYYGTLSAINTANWPSSSNVVIAYWSAITAWTVTGNTVPYLNLNDWLHFSSFPTQTSSLASTSSTPIPIPQPSSTQTLTPTTVSLPNTSVSFSTLSPVSSSFTANSTTSSQI